MLQRFDFTPSVSIIGPADDLLIVLQDLYEAFSFSEEYHEEYMQFKEAYLARVCKDSIYKKITAIQACEIIQPGKDREKEVTMNTVNLIGRMTKDPMIKMIDKGKDGELTQAVFTLAVDRGNDDADFIRCVAYGKTAEIIEDYTAKGVRVGVTGHIRTGSYEDKDGEMRYTQDVIVDRFDFADGKRDPEEADEKPAKKGGKRGRR